MYEALGGITRHASLADGYERQDKMLPMTDLGLLPHHPQSSAAMAADLRRDALPPSEATRLLRGKMAVGGKTRGSGRAITGSSEEESGASFSQPMSAAQAYAAKKAAAMEKAAAIREQRRIAQGQQMHARIAHADQDQPYCQGPAEESELDIMYRLSKQRLGR